MRNLALLTAPFLLAVSVAAHAACVYPQAPQNFPNGATATKEEMLTAQTAVKAYSTEVQDVYLGCLEKEKNDAIAALDSSDAERDAGRGDGDELEGADVDGQRRGDRDRRGGTGGVGCHDDPFVHRRRLHVGVRPRR